MRYQNILITGGAGFVGSNLALFLKSEYPDSQITAFDNLKRRGSEVNVGRLNAQGVLFVHGDVRSADDLQAANSNPFDLIIDCSAEPSVLAGTNGGVRYLIDTNLGGTINCLELARQHGAAMMFLSTSRVYPISALNQIETYETEDRFEISPNQPLPGISRAGISEQFPLQGSRSLYGATKLSSELFIEEYASQFGISMVINRCGVIAGAWQMGKVDQGVFTLWIARHYYGIPLSYNGFGGIGKQVRDLLHINDLKRLVAIQLGSLDKFAGTVFNVGGGYASSLSLKETTRLCEKITGRTVLISSEPTTHNADVKLYITDNAKITEATGWAPIETPESTIRSIYDWLADNEALVGKFFAP